MSGKSNFPITARFKSSGKNRLAQAETQTQKASFKRTVARRTENKPGGEKGGQLQERAKNGKSCF